MIVFLAAPEMLPQNREALTAFGCRGGENRAIVAGKEQ
jgi:hypothetical protein